MAWIGRSRRRRRGGADGDTESAAPSAESPSTEAGAAEAAESAEEGPESKPPVSRALNLLKFLRELAEQRSRSVRDVDSYEAVLWLSDAEGAEGCHRRGADAGSDGDPDLWLEATAVTEPEAPRPPESCEAWMDGDWRDSSVEPTLLESIVRPDPGAVEGSDAGAEGGDAGVDPDVAPGASDERRLEDHPEVVSEWEAYLAERWRPWAEGHQRWRRGRSVYRTLFEIHQAQERLGEAYELVLGLGLLAWRPEGGDPVRRHLVCADAELTLDADRGRFQVRPSSEGARLRAEVDMIDVQQRPAGLEAAMGEALAPADDDPWAEDAVDSTLRIAARQLHEDGSYERSLAAGRASAVPVVRLAPALILRKRSTRGLLQTIDAIRARISESGEVTPLMEVACETGTVWLDEDEDEPPPADAPQRVYLPLETNEQQERIVERAAGSRGVLVQGPPGTGKSHTIANLICHLLATEQRVLVTAQTPRALQVLVGEHGKLPEELRALCVGLMGRGRDELRSLEHCVDRILSKRERWDAEASEREIERLERGLEGHRRREAEWKAKLRQLREQETFEHVMADGAYRGTMARISRRVAAERDRFGWFTDTPDAEAPAPDAGVRERLGEFLGLCRRIGGRDEEELSRRRPAVSDVPSADEMELMLRRERDAREATARWADPGPWGEALLGADRAAVERAAAAVEELRAHVARIRGRPLGWIQHGVDEMLTDHDTPWRELHERTGALLAGLRERARRADELRVHAAPEELDPEGLLHEARRLAAHLRSRGSLGWHPLKRRPAPIRRAARMIRHMRVGGRPCDDLGGIETLIERLEAELAVRRLRDAWRGKAEPAGALLADQVAELEEHQEALGDVTAVYGLLEAAKSAVGAIGGVVAPAWADSEAVGRFVAGTRYALARREWAEARGELERAERVLAASAGDGGHPCVRALMEAVRARDATAYARSLEALVDLERRAGELARRDELRRELEGVVPRLVEAIRDAPGDERWPARLDQLGEAWDWARARAGLDELLGGESMEKIERQLDKATRNVAKTTAQLAAARAWRSCFRRMSDAHMSHLKAWRQAVRRLGKGTGKHAEKHRRDARIQLERCREAIPAWVMPLHRLYESVEPKPGMFDVAIVDEASQCGHDSLLLMYLAKRIIVVGDDRQITPQEGFVDGDAVDALLREHLPDLAHQDLHRQGMSLYHAAERWFPSSAVVLREHFRCVPEIIRFSNDLCYHASPLIPLRQYPPERLAPLERRHVESGYREGDGGRVINRPEAEALADEVAACCASERYEGKTMGVISLQGGAQARLIERMLLERLDAEEIERRRLVCGDAYAFQGDERHVMFLSMVAAPNKRPGALVREDARRRFNVAASRAQDQMWLFHSVTTNDLSPECMRRRLLEYFLDPRSKMERALGVRVEDLERAGAGGREPGSQPDPFESWFEVDVALELARAGYRVVPQYELAGKRIDLVVEGETTRLAVECDGDHWHGPERFEEDMHRQRQLERAGLRFCRVRESEFYAERESAMRPVWRALGDRGIRPIRPAAS